MTEKTVFVSYAAADRLRAAEVLRRLRHLPVRVWSDDGVEAGTDWQRTVNEQLQACDFFLLIVTPAALESTWVLQELGAAWALGKHIVALAIDLRLIERLPIELKPKDQVFTLDQLDRLGTIFGAAPRTSRAATGR